MANVPPGYASFASDRGITPPKPIRPPIAKVRPVKAVGAPKVAPPPLSDLQLAQNQVKTAYDPVIQQLTDAYNQRGTAQAAAINSGTQNLAQLMGQYGPAVQTAYNSAGGGLAAIQSALAGTQQGQGAAAQADLAQRLAATDPATAARISGGQSGDWAGQALANATKGDNNLAALLSEGAHAGEFGAKLPGIGGEIGFNALRQGQGQITSDLQSQLQALAAKEPGDVQAALSQLQTNKAQSAQLQFENALKNAEYGLNVKKLNASATQNSERIGIQQQNANTAAAKAQDASARGWASIGISQQRANAAEAKAQQIRKSGGITAGKLADIQAKAEKDAELFHDGVPAVTRADGTVSKPPTYSRTYQDALRTLLNRYPALGAKDAVKILNGIYKPGEFGRPAGKGVHFVNGQIVFGK